MVSWSVYLGRDSCRGEEACSHCLSLFSIILVESCKLKRKVRLSEGRLFEGSQAFTTEYAWMNWQYVRGKLHATCQQAKPLGVGVELYYTSSGDMTQMLHEFNNICFDACLSNKRSTICSMLCIQYSLCENQNHEQNQVGYQPINHSKPKQRDKLSASYSSLSQRHIKNHHA